MSQLHARASGLVLLALMAGCNAPEQPAAAGKSDDTAVKPVASVKQVMQGITVPASNIVFAVASEPPVDEFGWIQVENAALAVAESANLLLMEGRAIDRQAWQQHALTMLEAANKTAVAAQARNADVVTQLGDALYETCEGCHQAYMKAPQG